LQYLRTDLTSRRRAEKNLGRVFRKKNFPKAKNRQFWLNKKFNFRKKYTKEFAAKLNLFFFSTNLTILYPNPQKKIQLFIIFEKFEKKSKNRLF
jgi:hypothetical protein